MGILDELKKLTKPYNGEEYLEEDLPDPVRVGPQDNRTYASYAEAPQSEEQDANARRPYVFSQNQQPQQQGQQPYYEQPSARQPQRQPTYRQQQPYSGRSYPQGQQPAYQQPQQPAYAHQAKLLLVRPNKFELAADIADRIGERNAIVLNLEDTQKDVARRILDFLSGVTYAVGGKIKKVAGNTSVLTPAGMEFMGDSLEEMESKQSYF